MVNPEEEFEGVVQTSTAQDLESAVSPNQTPKPFSAGPQPVPRTAVWLRACRLRGELGCVQVATILAIAEGSSDPAATDGKRQE